MRHSLFIVFIFATMVLSGCHKLGKKRCNDCPKWNKIEIPKKSFQQV